MKLDTNANNARLVDGAGAHMAPLGGGALLEQGYRVYAVGEAQVLLHDLLQPGLDLPLDQVPIGKAPGFDLVVGGGLRRVVPGPRGAVPLGSVMRRGQLVHEGMPATAQRGGFAILADGSLIVAAAMGTSAAEIEERFGQEGNPVVGFLGGGLLLIEEGAPVSEQDLLIRQQVGGKPGGFQSPLLSADQHLIIGIKRGQCYVVVSPGRAGRELQQDLCNAEFGAAVKFDRGTGVFLDDGQICLPGRNPSGLGLRLHTHG